MLREDLNLTGAKLGCDVGDCGTCTVLVDGIAVNACLMLAGQANGKKIETIEGLSTLEEYQPIQKAFEEVAALQCGFCGPGMIMSTKEMIDKGDDMSKKDIRDALSGNLCRCTGYVGIVNAIMATAKQRQENKS